MSDSDGAAVAHPVAHGVGEGAVTEGGGTIGWLRAILSGVAVLAVAFGATVLAANAVLTQLTGVSRSTRQYLASFLFLVVVIAMAWFLRRLQARGLI